MCGGALHFGKTLTPPLGLHLVYTGSPCSHIDQGCRSRFPARVLQRPASTLHISPAVLAWCHQPGRYVIASALATHCAPRTEHCGGVCSLHRLQRHSQSYDPYSTTAGHGLNSIVNDSENKVFKLLPTSNNIPYELRKNKRFKIPEEKTNRCKNTFSMANCIKIKSIR